MKLFTRAALLAGLSWNACAADRVPLTAEDLVRLERVSDPQWSPDAASIAYTVTRADPGQGRTIRSVWIADVATGRQRPATGASGNADTPRWGPGGELYFRSDRSGSPQVWRFDMRGGQAQQVTDLPRDVGTYVVSPDGGQIALSLEVFRDCGSSLACTVTRLAERDASRQSGLLYDRLFVRHGDRWRDGTRALPFTARLDGGKAGPVTLVSGALDGDVPAGADGDARPIAFTPDGRRVVFSMRVAGFEEAWSTNLDLWIANSDGSGDVQGFTSGNPATDTNPVVTPNGQALVWLATAQPGYGADRYRILFRELTSRQAREIAPAWDRSPRQIALSADGRTVYAVADDGGQRRLFAIGVSDGQVTPLTGDGSVSGFSVGPGGIVVAHNALDRPDDLFVMRRGDREFRALTHQNADLLARIRMGSFEPFSFKGWNDEIVHGTVVKPARFESGRKYPVAFVVHDGPQASLQNRFDDRWNLQAFAGMGYAVVAIDFHGSTGYGQAFTDSVTGDAGGKPLEDLQKGWVAAANQFKWLDGGNACALGTGFGGTMMNWMESQWPKVFECLVNESGTLDTRFAAYATDELWPGEWDNNGTPYDRPEGYERHNPVNHVDQWQTPMLVIHGDRGTGAGIEQGIAAFTALQRRGIASQLLRFPDEGRGVQRPDNRVQWYHAVQAWLDRHLKDPPPG